MSTRVYIELSRNTSTRSGQMILENLSKKQIAVIECLRTSENGMFFDVLAQSCHHNDVDLNPEKFQHDLANVIQTLMFRGIVERIEDDSYRLVDINIDLGS